MEILTSLGFIVVGLALLVWSADYFVDAAADVAHYFKMPPLLIGMVIIGFGTSAPEMIVSAFSAAEGKPELALGNAFGSNIANIGLILGITALLKPILVNKDAVKKELPILILASIVAVLLLVDLDISRMDAWVLLILFFTIMAHSIYLAILKKKRAIRVEYSDPELGKRQDDEAMGGHEFHKDVKIGPTLLKLVAGLLVLMGSSKLLVDGAVDLARIMGVSELVIGLTIVAVGTSLPELAAAISAVKKGQNDFVLGNIIGSNLFNTLMVVGIAGAIAPMMNLNLMVLVRDSLVMMVLTCLVFAMSFSVGGRERVINRVEGGALFAIYVLYTAFLVAMETGFIKLG